MKLHTKLQKKLETYKIQSPQGFQALGAFSTMKTKDLIKLLQDMVSEYEAKDIHEVMGEHEIVIDAWKSMSKDNDPYCWKYLGFSGDIEITYSADGVYPILAAKETWA